MKHQELFTFAIVFIALGLGADVFARLFYIYGTYVWTDLFVHFIVALGLSVMVVWFFIFSRKENTLPQPIAIIFFNAVIITLLIGIIWELFEVIRGMERADNYLFDTTLDITMDIIGAVVGSFYIIWWQKKKIKNNLE